MSGIGEESHFEADMRPSQKVFTPYLIHVRGATKSAVGKQKSERHTDGGVILLMASERIEEASDRGTQPCS